MRGLNDICLDHKASKDGSRNARHVKANERAVLVSWPGGVYLELFLSSVCRLGVVYAKSIMMKTISRSWRQGCMSVVRRSGWESTWDGEETSG